MFEDLFTTYSSLDPPPIPRRQNVSNDSENIEPNRYSPIITINNPIIDESEGQDPFSSQTDKPQFIETQEQPSKQEKPLKGPKAFEEAFEEALKINPDIAKYKNFLIRTAKRESGFNSNIQNTAGAPYYGYFQMGKNEIALTTKMSVEQFRKDPVAQILGACKLYDMNLRTIKKLGVYDLGRERGYSDDALVSGAWMGGPGGVKKYLLGQGDPSDSHWYNGQGGSSVGKIMNNWKANE